MIIKLSFLSELLFLQSDDQFFTLFFQITDFPQLLLLCYLCFSDLAFFYLDYSLVIADLCLDSFNFFPQLVRLIDDHPFLSSQSLILLRCLHYLCGLGL